MTYFQNSIFHEILPILPPKLSSFFTLTISIDTIFVQVQNLHSQGLLSLLQCPFHQTSQAPHHFHSKQKSAPPLPLPPHNFSIYCQVDIYMISSSCLQSSEPPGFCTMPFTSSGAWTPASLLTTLHLASYTSVPAELYDSLKVKCAPMPPCFYTGYTLCLKCLFQILANFHAVFKSQIKCCDLSLKRFPYCLHQQ